MKGSNAAVVWTDRRGEGDETDMFYVVAEAGKAKIAVHMIWSCPHTAPE